MENNTMENVDTNEFDSAEKTKKFNGYLRKNNRKKKVEIIESHEHNTDNTAIVNNDNHQSGQVDESKENLIVFQTPDFIPNEVLLENKNDTNQALTQTENVAIISNNVTSETQGNKKDSHLNNRKSFKVSPKKETNNQQKTKKIQNVLKNKKQNYRSAFRDNDDDIVESNEIKTPKEIALNNLFYTIRKEHNINLFISAISEYLKYYPDFKQSTSDITVLNYMALYNKEEFLDYVLKNYPIRLFDLNDNNLKTMIKYSMNKSPSIIGFTLSILEKHYENKIPSDIIECIVGCSTQMMWREDSAKILFNWLTTQLKEKDKKALIEKAIEHINLTFTYFIYDNLEYSSLLKSVFNPEDDLIVSHPHSKKLIHLIGQSQVAKKVKKEMTLNDKETEDILSFKQKEMIATENPFHQVEKKTTLSMKKEENMNEVAPTFNDNMFKAKPTITIKRKKKTV